MVQRRVDAISGFDGQTIIRDVEDVMPREDAALTSLPGHDKIVRSTQICKDEVFK